MTLAILFWILMILSLVLGLWGDYVEGQPYPFKSWGHRLLVFVLLAILGWAQFGAPVH